MDELQQTSAGLPLPDGTSLAFWRGEVERADAEGRKYHDQWQNNIRWYEGDSPDAAKYRENTDFVNVNIDFYQVEQKLAQLFYETPELQLRGTGPLKGRDDILQAHRDLINELLDDCDVLSRAVHPAIKDCLAVSGVGPVLVGYTPTLRTVQPPMQPGSILGLQGPVQVPIYQQWFAMRFSPKKLLIPADWHDVPSDLTPWLGMRFRMPLAVARKEFADAFATKPEFTGTTERDEHVLQDETHASGPTGLQYVDGQVIFYRADQFDPNASHPELYRELVLIDGLDVEARHRDCPHQTILPNGQLSADSMRGNPIHPLSIRSVPDKAYTPSDSQMTRGLVREKCRFRTQMVQQRDADRHFVLYDIDKLPPDVIDKITNRTVGALIGVEGGALNSGVGSIFAAVGPASNSRQTYVQEDYITRDIEKTLAVDSAGAGVADDQNETATKTAEVARNRNVRLDHERRQVLRWYLALVDKFSAMVCRYLSPDLAATYLGPQAAQLWASWDKRTVTGRVAFSAKPDSQIRLDAAAERKFALQLYQMVANDPNVVRVELLKNLFIKAGYDPTRMVVDKLPEKKPEPRLGFSFKGADLINPQAQQVRELLAQMGLQISQESIDSSASQMYQQLAIGLRDASGKAVPTQRRPTEHGGPAQQVRSLSKQQGDETGQRPGPKTEAAA